VQCKIDKVEFKVRGKVVILAAGALFTPELLLKSKSNIWPNGLSNRSGYLGLNLMWHVSDVFAIKPKRPYGQYESKRQITFNDFYFAFGQKMGNIQEMGFNWFTTEKLAEILINRLTKFKLKILTSDFLFNRIVKVAHWYFRGASMYASVVEDLPYLHNKVFLKDGKLVYEYRYSNDLKKRSKLLRTLLQKKLKKKYRLVLLSNRDNINYGHACGTCRFGVDPKTSVLNPDNRSHDIKNLFVTDASFFPSSGGVNPSLTIAANAIRVAEKINNDWDMITVYE
jgi:choline dehydrogenase-like flavoprotein